MIAPFGGRRDLPFGDGRAQPHDLPESAERTTRVACMPGRDNCSEDIGCSSCRYNLRGLPPDGLCPECGYPILVSIESNEYRRSLRPPLSFRYRRRAYVLALVLPYVATWCLAPEVQSWRFQGAVADWSNIYSLLLALVGGVWCIMSRDARHSVAVLLVILAGLAQPVLTPGYAS